MLSTAAQLLVGGVLQGSIYALGAFGLSLIFGVLHVLNIAHGDFLMLGGLVASLAFARAGLPPFLTLFLVGPGFLLVGIVFHRLLIRPIADRPRQEFLIASILITLGASLAVEDITAFSVGGSVRGMAYTLPPIRVGTVMVSSLRLVNLGVVLLLTLLLGVVLRRTYAGRALRALMQSRDGARLCGIDVGRLSALAFGLGVALAATGGVLYVTLFPITPFIGIPLTLKYLCLIVMGGVGNLPGTLASGCILGVTEALVGFYLGAEWSLTVAFFLLVVILLWRPTGLFARGVA